MASFVKESARNSLQWRMTALVTAAVLLVSSAAVLLIAGKVHRDYEEIINDRISDNLAAITHIMEQRLLRVEEATETMAGTAPLALSGKIDLDTLLTRSIMSSESIGGMALIFDNEAVPSTEGLFEQFVYFDNDTILHHGSIYNGKELSANNEWNRCYGKGERCWCEFSTRLSEGFDLVSYFVPLYDTAGRRAGMAYSAIQENYLTSFVTRNKGRSDIDISIYKANGEIVVAPDDYILELPGGNLIVREKIIDHIGWKVVLSADKDIIRKKVIESTISMTLLFVLMFVLIFLAIKFTVRYVAKPFMMKQSRMEKEKSAMENEMRLAAGAQSELIPHVFPPFPDRKGIDISACLNPARSVGGDIYDYFLDGDRLFFCIGDVSGKGMPAALFMSAAHYLFRSTATKMPATETAVNMNISLCADNAQCRFITFWMGCLDMTSGRLGYVNAGHDSPVLLRDGRAESLPESENMPFGVLEDAEFVSGCFYMKPGDILFLYTDGVTEAMNTARKEFGRERLFEALSAVKRSSAGDIVGDLLDKVREYSAGAEQSDDITMLCLKFISCETTDS